MNNETNPFSHEELRLLHSGRLAVLSLVVRALVETHPKREELASAFGAMANGAKHIMRDLANANWNPQQRSQLSGALQDEIDRYFDDWLSLLNPAHGHKAR